jgi:tetratricopeptide (TPR) repeat protein
VRLLAARAARLTGDLPAAEEHLNRCLKLHGGATEEVQLEFLLVRAQTGEVEEVARPLIDAVEKGHPESPLILATLTRAYMARLRYRPALACLSKWLELRPDEARAYQWRGWVLERLGRHREARADYDKALERDPELFPARLRVAEMLLEDKHAEQALPHLERLRRQAPDSAEVLARLGMCRFQENQLDEARRLLEAAAGRLPKDPGVLLYLARLDLREGRAAEAERRLRQMLAADPSDTEALYNLGTALQAQGRTAEATATMTEYKRCKRLVDRSNQLLQEVADSRTARPADYAELGGLLLQIGRERQAVYWLERALESDPGQQQAHAALAEYYEKQGERDKAAAHRRWLPPAGGAQSAAGGRR